MRGLSTRLNVVEILEMTGSFSSVSPAESELNLNAQNLENVALVALAVGLVAGRHRAVSLPSAALSQFIRTSSGPRAVGLSPRRRPVPEALPRSLAAVFVVGH